MKIIGITGGVGAGKSTIVNEMLKRYNAVSLLADEAAKKLQQKGEKCYDQIISLLGENILDENGEIIPQKMAAQIFADESTLSKVNEIIHPAVKEYILNRIEEEKRAGTYDYFFLEAALLIECGYVEIVDEMWYIFADRGKRSERLYEQRGYSQKKVDSIVNNQLSDEDFRAAADFVVDNSYSLDDSMKQIDAHLRSM